MDFAIQVASFCYLDLISLDFTSRIAVIRVNWYWWYESSMYLSLLVKELVPLLDKPSIIHWKTTKTNSTGYIGMKKKNFLVSTANTVDLNTFFTFVFFLCTCLFVCLFEIETSVFVSSFLLIWSVTKCSQLWNKWTEYGSKHIEMIRSEKCWYGS